MSAVAEEKQLVVVHGGRGGISRSSLPEVWAFRDVLAAFVMRQVRVKYKQAAVGIGWSVLQPLLMAGIFALFLGKLAHGTSNGMPYFLFSLSGMVVWTTFSAAASGAMESLVSNQMLLRKVYFPREILPLSAVLAALFDLAPAFLMLCIVDALYGNAPTLSWLALPLAPLLIVLFASAVGLALSGLNVYYRDVRYALPFVLQIGLFASPIVYPLTIIPAHWRTLYEIANPVAAAIGTVRLSLGGSWPSLAPVAGAALWSLLLGAIGYTLFKRLERGFSDRV